MSRVIKVTGKGNISVRPDQTRLIMMLKGFDPSFEKTVELSSKYTSELKEALVKCGLKKESLKTTFFNIDPRYKSYQQKNGNWKSILEGYQFSHNLKVEFDIDNELLGQVFYSLSKCHCKPEVRIEYTVKDSEAVKNQLLAKAIEDAQAKASILATAAGVTLKEIENIDYSWKTVEFSNRVMEREILCDGIVDEENFNMDFEPEDIVSSDNVTVVWNME